jgi:GMP synthase-like glutamine amidotransferase
MYSTFKKEEILFNRFKYVHIVFYSVINSKIYYLLHSNLKSESGQFSEIHTEMSEFDNAPTFAASRVMTCHYNGLLTKKFIEETIKGKEINKGDFEEEHSWFEVWNSINYWEWLEEFSKNPIQYEKLENRMIYFMEIPFLDTDLLQINFNILNSTNLHIFKYFSLEEILEASGIINNMSNINDEICVSHSLGKIFNLIDPDNHIKQTVALFTDDLAEKVYIISCKPPEKCQKDQAGIYHFRALFQGLFRNNCENWIFLTASVDSFPNDDMLKNTKAVIIPGSHISVYDDYEYLTRTKEFLYNLAKNYPDIRILGICFGAQMVAEALGGRVRPMKRDYFSGIELIQVSNKFFDYKFVNKSGVSRKEKLELLKFHGDEIKIVPQGFKVLGTSESCKNEILVSESGKILLIQGHPEYETKFVFLRSLSKKLKKNRNIKKAEKYIQSFYQDMRHYNENAFRQICFAFLKYA